MPVTAASPNSIGVGRGPRDVDAVTEVISAIGFIIRDCSVIIAEIAPTSATKGRPARRERDRAVLDVNLRTRLGVAIAAGNRHAAHRAEHLLLAREEVS
jgi:hypothetical protein